MSTEAYSVPRDEGVRVDIPESAMFSVYVSHLHDRVELGVTEMTRADFRTFAAEALAAIDAADLITQPTQPGTTP